MCKYVCVGSVLNLLSGENTGKKFKSTRILNFSLVGVASPSGSTPNI